MKTMIITLVTATAVSMSAGAAHAWGKKGNSQTTTASSGGLVNIAPSVGLGNVSVLNGLSVLNGAAILSGNTTNVGNGILSGIGVGILSGNNKNNGNSSGGKKRR